MSWSTQDRHLNNVVSTWVFNAKYQVSRPSVNWFWRRSLKVFTIYGRPYWSCDLDGLNIFFVWANPEGYILNMVTIGLMAYEEMFETDKLWYVLCQRSNNDLDLFYS